jgi:hypothetical protein
MVVPFWYNAIIRQGNMQHNTSTTTLVDLQRILMPYYQRQYAAEMIKEGQYGCALLV